MISATADVNETDDFRTLLLIAGLCLLLAGCGPDPPAESATKGGSPRAEAVTQDVPAAGAVRRIVEVDGDRIRIDSPGAENLEILQQLADLMGFELVVVGVSPRSVTIALDGVGLADAAAALLAGARFDLEYLFDDELGRHVPVRLSVGDRIDTLMAQMERSGIGPKAGTTFEESYARKMAKAAAKSRAKEEAGLTFQATDPAARRREREARAKAMHEVYAAREAEAAANEAELVELLASDDPDERSEAATLLPIGRSGLDPLVAVLESDPDAGVRSTVAERLAAEGTFRATQALVDALGDRDPSVVLAAIEGLRETDDPTTADYLAPLIAHRDAAVREQARRAREYLTGE